MDTQTETGAGAVTTSRTDLARRGGIALVLVIAVNVALVFVAESAGIAPLLEPLATGPVVMFTTLGVVGATLVYGLLTRFRTDPDRLFALVAGVVLLLSLIPDATYAPTLPGATTPGVAMLAVMHVTAAVVCVAVLTDLVPWP